MPTRMPCVAGQFYSGTATGLKKQLSGLVDPKAKKEKIIGAVVPHAGYIYSGRVAGEVISLIKPSGTFIILGPNHTGYGQPFSIMTSGAWKTPLGEVKIDEELSRVLLDNSEILAEDDLAHRAEHSLEVQLPFLQYLFSSQNLKIVPIVIAPAKLTDYQALGKELFQAVKQLKKEVVVLASSDLTHYEAQESAQAKDKRAIERILNLDEQGLGEIVEQESITMCGLASVATLLSYAKEMKAAKARLIKYVTSGEASGDFSSVVGYAGIIIS